MKTGRNVDEISKRLRIVLCRVDWVIVMFFCPHNSNVNMLSVFTIIEQQQLLNQMSPWDSILPHWQMRGNGIIQSIRTVPEEVQFWKRLVLPPLRSYGAHGRMAHGQGQKQFKTFFLQVAKFDVTTLVFSTVTEGRLRKKRALTKVWFLGRRKHRKKVNTL